MSARPGGDFLTRTTLQFDGMPSGTLIGDAVRALQRVPGVLLADLNPATARALVAHDGAVPVASLVSAVSRTGCTAHVVGAVSAATGSAAAAAPAGALRVQRLPLHLVIMGALVGTMLLVDAFAPNLPQKRYVLDAGVLVIWIVFFAAAFLRRRT